MEMQVRIKKYLKVMDILAVLLLIAFYISLYFVRPADLFKQHPEFLTYWIYVFLPIILASACFFIVLVLIYIKRIWQSIFGKFLALVLVACAYFIKPLAYGQGRQIVRSIFHITPALLPATTKLIGKILLIPMWINFVSLGLIIGIFILYFLMFITTLPFMSKLRKKFNTMPQYVLGLASALILVNILLNISQYNNPNSYKRLATAVAIKYDCFNPNTNSVCKS